MSVSSGFVTNAQLFIGQGSLDEAMYLVLASCEEVGERTVLLCKAREGVR